MNLFLYFFNIQRTFAKLDRSQWLLCFKGKKVFKVYIDNLNNFKYRNYIVTFLICILQRSIWESSIETVPVKSKIVREGEFTHMVV